jgi:phenylpropionate dioxygenase-like ring-hydroxylating dioxygenase large terminal subunit
MFVRNCWYVVAWDTEVAHDRLLARTVIGVPLVLWRDSAGAVVAFEDRCCHRGAPLSLGIREGDRLRCRYHGLVFDRTGQCVEAPMQSHIPHRARVRSFPVAERHRWIWVWMGGDERADPALIPDTRWLDHPEWRSLDGYLHYDTNYLLVADNLLDFSHLPFLHPSSVGGSTDYAAVLPTVEKLERGVRLTKWVMDTEPPAYSAKYAGYASGTKVDRWMFYDFIAPGVLLMHSGMAPVGTGAREGKLDRALEFRGCQALTPETDNSTHYFFAHPHNFRIDEPGVTRGIHEGILVAFEEDRVMITAQQRNLALNVKFHMVALDCDSALAQYRWVVTKLCRDEAEAASASAP